MPPDAPTFTAAQLAYIEQTQSVTTHIAKHNAHLCMMMSHADPVVVAAAHVLAPIVKAWTDDHTPSFEREVVQVEIVLTGGEGTEHFVGNSGTEVLPLPDEVLARPHPHIRFVCDAAGGWSVYAATTVTIDGEPLASQTEAAIYDGHVVRIGWTEITVRIPGS